jgi:hypothetical protein
VVFECVHKVGVLSQRASNVPFTETFSRPKRQWVQFMSQKIHDFGRQTTDWVLAYRTRIPMSAIEERGARQRIAVKWLPGNVPLFSVSQSLGYPRRDRNAYRIADHSPSGASGTADVRLFNVGPPGRESLEPFCVTDVGRPDSFTLPVPDRRWGRDSDSGTTLERRNRVIGPADAAITFSPVEAMRINVVAIGSTSVGSQQHRGGIHDARCDEKPSASTMRKFERRSVDYAICPTIVTEF